MGMDIGPASPAVIKLGIISDLVGSQVWVVGIMDPNGNISTSIMVPSEQVLDGMLEVMQGRLKILREKMRDAKTS